MVNTTIPKEIKDIFIEKLKEADIIQDDNLFVKFSELFDDNNIPTVKQLKSTLFDEELP